MLSTAYCLLTKAGSAATNFGISEIVLDGGVDTGIFRFGPVPQRGGSRSSRTRGGMRWTRQRQARNWVLQGGHFGARERAQGNADDGAACVRRSRVVLASVAGVKGRRAGVQIRTPETLKPDGDKNEFVTGESTKETVKPLRGECRVVPV